MKQVYANITLNIFWMIICVIAAFLSLKCADILRAEDVRVVLIFPFILFFPFVLIILTSILLNETVMMLYA